MIQPRSQCDTCARFRSPFSRPGGDFSGGPFCVAFPEGIPEDIYANLLDHRQPIDGDNGFRWISDGDPFPTYAFQPEVIGRGSEPAAAS